VQAGRDPFEIGKELAHAAGASEHVAEAVGAELLALDHLVEWRDGERAVSDVKRDRTGHQGIEDAHAADERAVRRATVAQAKPFQSLVDLAVEPGHGVVREGDLVFGRSPDSHQPAGEMPL